MKYLPLIWAALRRKPTRSILTLLSVTVGFALFGLMMGLNASFQRVLDQSRQDVIGVFTRFSAPMTSAMGEQIAKMPNIAEVGRLQFLCGYYRDQKNNVCIAAIDTKTPYLASLWRLTPDNIKTMIRNPTGIYVSRKSAERFRLKSGDIFPLVGYGPRADGTTAWSFRVLGILDDILNSPEGFFAGNFDMVDKSFPPEVRGRVTWLQVQVKDSGTIDATAQAIDKHFANSPVPTLSRSENMGAQMWLKTGIDMGMLTQRVAAVGMFLILLLTGHGIAQSVRERRSEFAAMKTLGFSDRGVMGLVFAEAVLPCVAGAALGMGLASVLALYVVRWLPNNLAIQAPYMSPGVYLTAFGTALLLAFLGAAWPALRLKKLNVADALAGR